MKKIVVFYYTQSGQVLNIMHNICQPIVEAGDEVIYKEIVPEKKFPFYWNCSNFFEIFPETRLGIPPYGIKEMDLSDVQDVDLVIVAGQSWYLSPSLPIQSFFISEQVKEYLKGRNIIFVNGCRNMWYMTIRKIRKYVFEAKANLVGHIVLQDMAANLVSVITIVRWLLHGKKEASGIWPRAGVSEKDIKESSRFGKTIKSAMDANDYSKLQEQLMDEKAIIYKPGLIFIEKTGHRIFDIWAKFIRKKGGYEDKNRSFRKTLFFLYLFFVLYIVSPIGILVFYLTYPIRALFIGKQKREACYNLGWSEDKKIQ